MMAFKCGSCGGIYTDINTHMYTVHMQRPRPFRVGDRVRYVVPPERRSPLAFYGIEPTGTGTHLGRPHPDAIDPDSAYVDVDGYGPCGLANAWLTHIDVRAIAAPRAPDRACRWCHGTGSILLVFSNAPCECVS